MRFHNMGTALTRRKVCRWWLVLSCVVMWLAPGFAQTFSSSNSNSFNSGSSTSGSSGYNPSSSSSSYNSGTNSSNSSHSSSQHSSTSKSKSSSRYSEDIEKKKNRNKGKTTSGVRGATKSTAVTRKGAKPANKAKSSAPAAPLAPIKVPGEYKENALYFQPAFAELQPGDRFMTPIFFYNTKKLDAGQIDLWLKYDPAVLEPEWVDTKPMKDRLGSPLDVRFWREEGYLRIQGKLANPLNETINPLPIVHWHAIGAIGMTVITFAGPSDTTWPAIYAADEDLLKPTNLGHRSLAEFQIGIAPPETTEPGLRMIKDVRDALPKPTDDPANRVRLVINPGRGPLAAGDLGLADVVLINPQRLGIDMVRFRILYDPAAVQILDADEDNYIRDGINIFDGDFHKTMPFDQHIANLVDPTRGVIDYSVGSASGPQVYPSGPLARIVYRVLRTTGHPAFQFQMVDPVTDARCTDVGTLGRSLLGEDLQLAREALNGAYLPLAPGRS